MILCGTVFAAAVLARLCCGKRLPKEWKKMLEILSAAALLGIFAGYAGRTDVLLGGNRLMRREMGEGSYEQELIFTLEGDEEDRIYRVTVPEQMPTGKEEEAYLQAARLELEADFPGENPSVNEIRGSVNIRDTYQNGKVAAEWRFDDYRVVDFDGNVIAEELPEEGTLVGATVLLVCGTSSLTESFYFQVFPAMRDEQEQLLYDLAKQLKAEGELRGAEFLELPEQLGEHQLTWELAQDRTPEKLLALGALLAAAVPLLESSRRQEDRKKRDRLLEIEYPDIVSKMALLLGAGMTLQGAFRKIAFSYEEKKKQHKCPVMPAYEEMLTACRELESGQGESRAYERFGERCGRADYRKFGSILSQNLRKGSQDVIALLEQEAGNAFEERRSAAKRYGEEAGTKLLVPMILMLGIVMVILMVPAMQAFKI